MEATWSTDKELLIEGDAYWVTDGDRIAIAFRVEQACGGWKNGDIWEDFYDEVVAWIHIKKPSPPEKLN